MNDDELRQRLDRIEQIAKATKSEASDKGHFFIIIALIILLMKSCDL